MKSSYILPVFLLFLLSCNSYKKAIYVRGAGENPDTLYSNQPHDYLLQYGDVLYVRVITGDEESDKVFNPTMGQSGTSTIQAGNMYLVGYVIDPGGYIHLPVLGSLKAAGYTASMVQDSIQSRAGVYIKQPLAIAKLASFRYSVLGEVRAPGFIEAPAAKISILEALARAGDITYYGNRSRVLVLRQAVGGTTSHSIDLTREELLSSPSFYLQPNDIVYVQPMRAAPLRARAADYLTLLGSVTSTITAIALIITLAK